MYYETEDLTPPVAVTRMNVYPGGKAFYSLAYPPMFKRRQHRYGTDSPSLVIHQPASTGFRKKLVRVRGGKVLYRTEVLKTVRRRYRKGNGVYATKVIKVWVSRLKREYPIVERIVPVHHKAKDINIFIRRVNLLDYFDSKVLHYPFSFVCSYPPDNRYYQTYSGDMYRAFSLLSTNTPVGHTSNDFHGMSSNVTNTVTRLLSTTHADLIDRISDQKVNLAQFFAERQQTYTLLAEAVSRLSNAFRAFRKRDPVNFVRSLFPSTSKELASDILAWKFGVVPLISDIEGMVANLQKFDVSSKRVKVSSIDVQKRVPIASLEAEGIRSVVYEDYEISVKRGAHLKVTSDALRSFQKLGLTNLATLAWELTPWSFVADWIFSVGNTLSSIEALAGVELVGSWHTVFIKRRVYCEYSTTLSSHSGYVWSSVPATLGWSIDQVWCVRTPVTDLTIAPWVLKPDPLTLNHLLLSVSLLRQQFK